MKVKNLKQWDLFFNTNGYICLVHRVSSSTVEIINTHGSMYNLTRDSKYEYSDKVPNISVKRFLGEFPTGKLTHHTSRTEFFKLKDRYFNRELPKSRLLLLL